MNKKNIVYGLMALVILMILGYTSGIFNGEENYLANLQEERQEKDDFMKGDSESPLNQEQKKEFKGLSYYPPNPDYQVNARLTPFQNKEIIKIPTSDNAENTYIKYAIAEFELHDTTQSLVLLKSLEEEDPDAVFLAFTDKTSGEETYGGGRYIDLQIKNDRRVIIDFNKAYNPYCMYNENYSCPFPPRENHLKVAIKAGEKKFKE